MIYPNWVSQRAHLSGDRMALSYDKHQWTFSEINEIAIDTAGKLASFGITSETRVAILAKSHPDSVFVMYACLHLGCEMVMLNERLSAAELSYQLEDSEAAYLLVDDELQTKIDADNKIPFHEINKAAPANFVPISEWTEQRTISIMYTSGTTGFPKGVRQTAQNHFSSAISSALNIGISPKDVWLCVMPLFHISGFSILMRSLIYGMGVRLHPKFDANSCAQELSAGTVTHMSVVAVTLERVLNALETEGMEVSSKFKSMLAGGGPVPISYMERAEKFGISVLQTYGMTETSSQTTTLQPADAKRKIGSSGKPLFLYQVRIDNDEPAGANGEIQIRGPQVTPGYIGKYVEREVMENGWFPTGDIGYLDEEGFLYVVDRRSDLIVSGGENIYPAEIEKVLLGHPAVLEAGVCGMADEKWGEVPAAFIVLTEGVSIEEIKEYLQSEIAGYKIPQVIMQVEALPRNASNKVLRRELKTWV